MSRSGFSRHTRPSQVTAGAFSSANPHLRHDHDEVFGSDGAE